MGLEHVPTLVLAHIAQYLTIDDVVCLAHTCRRLLSIIGPSDGAPHTAADESGAGPSTGHPFWTLLLQERTKDEPNAPGEDVETLAHVERRTWDAVSTMIISMRASGRDVRPEPFLFKAARRGRLDVVRWLQAAHVVDHRVWSSVALVAAGEGHSAIYQHAVRNGASLDGMRGGNPSWHDVPGSPYAMEWACANGHVNVVRDWLSRPGVVLNSIQPDMWLKMAHAAIDQCQMSTLGVLLDHASFPAFSKGRTIERAIKTQDVGIVRALVEHSSVHNATHAHACEGYVKVACEYPNVDMVRFFLDRIERLTSGTSYWNDHPRHDTLLLQALRTACLHQHYGVVRLLLDEPLVRAVAHMDLGQSLCDACRGGNVLVVEALVDDPVLGAETYCERPLDVAVHEGHEAVVRFLLTVPRFATRDELLRAYRTLALKHLRTPGTAFATEQWLVDHATTLGFDLRRAHREREAT